MESKLPRAVLGVLVGIAFGVGGAIFQSTLRNPLASPDIIGVSTGASAAAVFAIVVLGQRGTWVAVAAVVGAVLTALLVRSQAGPGASTRLVLVGVGVSAALFSVVSYLFVRADQWDVQIVLQWLTGSLNRGDWPTIRLLAVLLLVLAPVVVWLGRAARAAELGEDTAAGLGTTARHTDLLLLLAVLLVALGRRRRRADRVRLLPRRPDRPRAQRRPDHAGRRRPGRRGDRRRRRLPRGVRRARRELPRRRRHRRLRSPLPAVAAGHRTHLEEVVMDRDAHAGAPPAAAGWWPTG